MTPQDSIAVAAIMAANRAGQYAAAESSARVFLSSVEARGDTGSLAEARGSRELAAALWRGGKASDPDAQRAAERAVSILERVVGASDLQLCGALDDLAEVHLARGEYAEGRKFLERAISVARTSGGPDDPRLATALVDLGSAASDVGDYPEAKRSFEEAIAVSERNGRSAGALTAALNDLAETMTDMGDYHAAEPLYRRAMALAESSFGAAHPHSGMLIENYGILLHYLGDFTAARTSYERALAILEKSLGADHSETARCLENLATLYQDLGEYDVARSMLERVLAIRTKAFGRNNRDVAWSLSNLGVLAGASGDLRAEISLQKRALSILDRVVEPNDPALAIVAENLGVAYLHVRQLASARSLFQRVLRIRRQAMGDDSPLVARALENLAQARLWAGAPVDAVALLEQSLALEEKTLGPEHWVVAGTLGVLTSARCARGDTARALDATLREETIARENLRLTTRTLLEAPALRYARVRNSGLDWALTLAARGLAPADAGRVWDSLIRSRSLVLDEMASRNRSLATTASGRELDVALGAVGAQLTNLLIRGPGEDDPAAYRALVDSVRALRSRLEDSLAERSPALRAELERGHIGLDEVAAALPAGTALLGYAGYALRRAVRPDGPPCYVALILHAGQTEPRVVALGAAGPIDSLVEAWRQAAGKPLRADDLGQEAAARRAGEALRHRIWDPIASSLQGATRVFVVPDGTLALVNFAALPARDGQYLLETGPELHLVSAERDLVPSTTSEPMGTGLLALGGPDYDAGQTERFASATLPASDGRGDRTLGGAASYRGVHAGCTDFRKIRFSALSGAALEVQDVSRLWNAQFEGGRSSLDEQESQRAGTEILSGASASEAAVRADAPGRRVLHFATHGFVFGGACGAETRGLRGIGGVTRAGASPRHTATPPVQQENPLRLCGLALAGANHRDAVPLDADDGILTAEEIASFDLHGVQWAVLSACETGLGGMQSGEGVLGLRRAFEIAGVRTLIMSLWQVQDTATRRWMDALYAARCTRNEDTPDAVRDASLTVLRERRAADQSTLPFYWAGFVASGDWR